jgi:hypothetical protein
MTATLIAAYVGALLSAYLVGLKFGLASKFIFKIGSSV